MKVLFDVEQTKEQAARQRPCKGCYYLGGGSCNYLIVEGRRRPCPPGADCTAYRSDAGSTSQYRAHSGAMSGTFPASPHKGKVRKTSRVYRSPAMDALEHVGEAEMYAQGASDGAIAQAAGVSARSVSAWREKTGRSRNYEPGEKPRGKKNSERGNL